MKNYFFTLFAFLLVACSGNNRSKELSCIITDKDGQEWYISKYHGETILHNNGVVTNIGTRQKLEETNVFSGYNNGHNYYSLTFTLNGSNLIEKVVDRVPVTKDQHTRYYEYKDGCLVKIIEELSEINDSKIIDRSETELIWENEDLVDIIKHSVDLFDGSPSEVHYRILYGKEQNPLRCLFACLPFQSDIDLFVASGYFGLGPKHLPIGINYGDEKQSISIKLNPNGTVASEDIGKYSILSAYTIEYSYEKVK